MGGEAAIPLRPGDVIADTFVIDRVLGVGGMGVVFAATDLRSSARVALKCLLPAYCDHRDVVARFHREARATSRLASRHVVHVFESGTVTLRTGEPPEPTDVPFIVMEHLDGSDLRSLVRSDGPLSFEDAAAYVTQACVALAEAHALGIVHRDLKPANLFLTRSADGAPLIKVLDFGIAKFTSPSVAGDLLEMTRTRAVLGSRAYMAPEQMLQPKAVDARADVWALGVILFFLVTGKNPFAAETVEAMILRILQDAPTSLASLRDGAPGGFEAVIARCLAKARDARFDDVTDLMRALAPFAERRPDRAPGAHPAAPADSWLSDDLVADGSSGTILPEPPPAPPPSSSTMRAYALATTSDSSPIDASPSAHDTSAPTRVITPRPRKRRASARIAGAGAFAALAALGIALHLHGALAASGAEAPRAALGAAPRALAEPLEAHFQVDPAPATSVVMSAPPAPEVPAAASTAPSRCEIASTEAMAEAMPEATSAPVAAPSSRPPAKPVVARGKPVFDTPW